MKFYLRILLAASCVPFSLGCLLSGSGSSANRITLTGSSTVAPVISEIAKRFETLHPDVRIDVQTGGSSRGIRDAQSGAADIGMSSRSLNAKESQELSAATIAWDGVTFVVHRDNPITELTKDQLRGIYTGSVDNWSQVGGVDAPIVVSNRAEGRSELQLMSEFLEITTDAIRADVVDGETQQSLKTVTTNRNAIVYTSVGAAQHAASGGEPIKLLPLNGVEASMKTVQSGKFPLARPLVLIQRNRKENEWALEFIRFARSREVDEVTRSLGFVPPRRDG